MAVSILEGKGHSVPDLTGLGLPGPCCTRKLAIDQSRLAHRLAILTKADGRDLRAGVEGEMRGGSHYVRGVVILCDFRLGFRTGGR